MDGRRLRAARQRVEKFPSTLGNSVDQHPKPGMKIRILLLALFTSLVNNNAAAQSVSGTISGFVKDPQGAAIASVSVLARHARTAALVSTLSGEDGYYRLQ